jgi:hypothetical protein
MASITTYWYFLLSFKVSALKIICYAPLPSLA